MAKVTIPFVGEPYAMPAQQLDSQTCINWYATYDKTGKFPEALLPTDGLKSYLAFSDENIRGMLELNNVLYVVAGKSFYVVQTNQTSTKRGTLKVSTGNIIMIPNNNQIFITDGTHAYVYQYVATEAHTLHEFYEVTATTSNIGNATFSGAGLNDMTSAGSYTGTDVKKFVVEIFKKGDPDEFKWSVDDGETFSELIEITGLTQVLGTEGVEIKFSHITGHTLYDKWSFTATPVNTFFVPVIPATQDGYGIYIKQLSDRFYISSINDFSAVNSLDFARETVWPDYLQAAISIREELWLIGRTITRIWYNTGAEAFPFEPRTNIAINYGTIAPYSLAVAHNNILLWLGNNNEGGRIALQIINYEPVIISTEPIHNEWNTYSKVDDAIGFIIQKNGHVFYHLVFPTADRTWVYDLTTKLWHEKRSLYENEDINSEDSRLGRWRGNNYAYFDGKHLVGDWTAGDIYLLNSNVYKDFDKEIRRERTTRTVDKDLQRMFVHSLQVDMEYGVGLTDDQEQGHDPQIMLQVSKDDGITWGNELWRSFGKTGEYGKRAKWNRLGAGRSFTFRLRTTDPVYTAILGAVAEVEVSET